MNTLYAFLCINLNYIQEMKISYTIVNIAVFILSDAATDVTIVLIIKIFVGTLNIYYLLINRAMI